MGFATVAPAAGAATSPCLILGDSLAAGVAAARPDCRSDTVVGIDSGRYLASHLSHAAAGATLISLGANDSLPTAGTASNLIELRAGLQTRRLFWILPARPRTLRDAIRSIAATFGDRLIETAGSTGPDGLHLRPSAYRAIGLLFDLPSNALTRN